MVNIKFDNRNYYFPVKDGKMSSALWVNAHGFGSTRTVTDFSNNSTSDFSNIFLLTRTNQHINLYIATIQAISRLNELIRELLVKFLTLAI